MQRQSSAQTFMQGLSREFRETHPPANIPGRSHLPPDEGAFMGRTPTPSPILNGLSVVVNQGLLNFSNGLNRWLVELAESRLWKR